MLAILNGSSTFLECGTSFGVTTIYMALAAVRNIPESHGRERSVITIEKSGQKLEEAQKLWKEAGRDIQDCIDAREGDVLEVLTKGVGFPDCLDLVFLDGKPKREPWS